MFGKNKGRGIWRLIGCFLILCSLFSQSIFGAEAKASIQIDEVELQHFIDDYMKKEMQKEKIAGAVAVVVKDGHEVLKKGYGYSDIEKKIPVDPDITTFPIASVSKLFTATAIMQLYERNQIDLHEDIQKEIGNLAIDNPYERKITCSNLLTHSSGLDEGSELLVGTTKENEIKPQEAYFKTHKLKVIEQPDKVSRYANTGYNLLGYIIEKKSGQSYEQFIKENILNPLDMKHTSIGLHDEQMSKGYEVEEDNYMTVPYAYQYARGSGSIISTAADMENFLKAYLNKGSLDKKRILKPETIQLMEGKRFANDDILAGMGYGFIRMERNGHLILKHEGALPGYMSTMMIIPEAHVGIYISVNTFQPLPFRFEEAFLNHFMPRKHQAITGQVEDELKQYVGVYRNYDGISQSTLMKACILFDSATDSKVRLNSSGQLELEEYNEEKERVVTRLIAIEKGRFIRADGKGYYTFRREADGHISYAFNEVSHNAFQKIHGYERKEVLWCIVGSTLLLLVVDFIINVHRMIKNKKVDLFIIGNILGALGIIVGSIGAIFLIFIMVMQYDYHLIIVLKLFLTMLLLGSGWTMIRLARYIWKWQKGKITWPVFIYQLSVVSLSLLYSSVLWYCQLIGYKIS